jgi:hypothetical protein
MHQAIAPSLEAWASFYVIVGSSAGALTGLQFVVMTLISASGRTGGLETISAFGSPNVVHFCVSLLVASILSIPWRGLHTAGVAVALCGALGVLYVLIVMRRAARQRTYQPVFEDWLWHVALPILAYAVLFVAGGVLAGAVPDSLFFIGPAALLLVFIGIHNAWDTVTFLTATSGQPSPPPPSGPPATPGE